MNTFGVNGTTGKLVDIKKFGIWEPVNVKTYVYKTAKMLSCYCFWSKS